MYICLCTVNPMQYMFTASWWVTMAHHTSSHPVQETNQTNEKILGEENRGSSRKKNRGRKYGQNWKESCRKIGGKKSRRESMEENDFIPEAFSSSSASSSPPAPREEEAARAAWISCAIVVCAGQNPGKRTHGKQFRCKL